MNHVEERCHEASSETSEDSEDKELHVKERRHEASSETSERKELHEAINKSDIILHDLLNKITELKDTLAEEKAKEVTEKLKDLRETLCDRGYLSAMEK